MAALAYALNMLNDVIITAAATKDFLYFDGTNWVDHAIIPADINAQGVATTADVAAVMISNTAGTAMELSFFYLNMLSDTVIATPVNGQVLTYNGTSWVNATPAAGSTYTDEQVRDVMGVALVAGTNVAIAVDDAANTITISATTSTGGVTDHAQLTSIGTNTHVQIDSHLASIANPHTVTKAQVGLGSVDNTTDAAKPVSTAQQTALNLKQDKAWETLERLAATVATSLATAVDITGLNFAVNNGEVWAFDVYLRVVGNTAGMKYTWTHPGGTVSKITTGSLASVATITASAATGSGSLTVAFGTAVYVGWAEVHGTISATANGTVQFQFAATTAGQSVSVETGSYLIARRIS